MQSRARFYRSGLWRCLEWVREDDVLPHKFHGLPDSGVIDCAVMWTYRDAQLHYAWMKLARDLDARFESLLLTGRVAKWYSQVGNEATTVAAGMSLEFGDTLVSLHRDLGAILAIYLDPDRTFPGIGFPSQQHKPAPEDLLYRLACQLLGRDDGFSHGIERSFHYQYANTEAGIDHVGMISHLGAMIPVAAGAAFAHQQRRNGRVAMNFIGDGGTSTGDFHEALNMAGVWRLPLVLVVENNGYAFSTPTRLQYACERLSDRALGYGIAGATVDGNDPQAMSLATQEAVGRARGGGGPTLIEAMLGRMKGHSEGDDSLKVVPRDDLSRYQAQDPVPAMRKRLLAEGMDDALLQRIEARVSDLVETSLGRALEAQPPDPGRATVEVFAPMASLEPETSLELETDHGAGIDASAGVSAATSYVDAIAGALRDELEGDPTLVLMGQDIAEFEGAFRVTRGLYDRWPERIRDTPIAESGTLGIAIGCALAGIPVVVEMQFADFVTCGFNQIVNVAAKTYYRWQRRCPIVVRLPSGGGVGAGPFHSQNPEAWFAHVAGLKVVCPATAADAGNLLRSAIRDPNPVIFLEHKYLYRRIKEVLPTTPEIESLGQARVVREGHDVSLIAYGSAVWWCQDAADELAEEGINAEVVDLRSLVPLDEQTILASVQKTGRAVVVHEAQRTGGFGGEVAALIAEKAFAWLDAPVERVAYPDRPVPYAKNLEKQLLPQGGDVAATARRVLSW